MAIPPVAAENIAQMLRVARAIAPAAAELKLFQPHIAALMAAHTDHAGARLAEKLRGLSESPR